MMGTSGQATENTLHQLKDVVESDAEPASIAKEILDVEGSAIGLTSAVYGTAKKAFITVDVAGIRLWFDGSTPTASEGHVAFPYDVINLSSAEDIANFKAIRISDSAKLMVTYSE